MSRIKRTWPQYEQRGYNQWDGLGEGHWITVPNSAGIRRWVGELESKALDKRNARRGLCVDCDSDIDVRSTRCRSCHGRDWNERLRDAS